MRVMSIEYDPLVPPVGHFLAPSNDDPRSLGRIPVDAYRQAEVLVLHCDMPGVDPDSIEVCISERALALQAFRPALSGPHDNVLLAERVGGMLYRSVDLPTDVDVANALADFEEGVLTVTIPLVDQVPACPSASLPLPPERRSRSEPPPSPILSPEISHSPPSPGARVSLPGDRPTAP